MINIEIFMLLCGWLGTLGLFLFYWLLGSGKVLPAYIYGTIGAFGWLIVGIGTMYSVHVQLPSLILMESVVIIMNIRGILNWRKENGNRNSARQRNNC